VRARTKARDHFRECSSGQNLGSKTTFKRQVLSIYYGNEVGRVREAEKKCHFFISAGQNMDSKGCLISLLYRGTFINQLASLAS
jgi:hypothetical protein